MIGDALPRTAWRAARRRDIAIVAAFALPWLAAIVATAIRCFDGLGVFLATALSIAATIIIAAWRWRRRDARWLVRALDARRADMEDSADLLVPQAARTGLQQLQRQRLQQRLAAQPPELRTAWPWPALGVSLLVAGSVFAAAMLWPMRQALSSFVPPALARVAAGPIRMTAQAVTVIPPSYTNLSTRTGQPLSLKAPQGAQLRWHLKFSSPPAQATLVFTDGRRITLTRDGDDWNAALRLDASALYHLEIDGRIQADKPYRLDAIQDRPPQVKATEPAQTANQAAPRQRNWALRFEASDDYGVAAGATLRLTTAKGSGENVAFQQREVRLSGSGSASARHFAYRVDLAALGLEPGDEVVARLSVRDNRSPQPQEAHSASLILRLPSTQDVQGSDLEAAIKKVMPAYFRSQRQIILDAEALLKQRRALDADTYLKRSDAIGVDQRILRLRYGQFLGEEAEGGAKPPPTNDQPAADAPAATDDGHDHEDGDASDTQTPVFGNASDVLSAYGHTHDHAEAATLLDPQTRAILKQALDQMWQSEGELRQGHPDKALPYAYKALGFIKQVQQAERIYLARVGPDLPSIDETRRMTGKRDGLASRTTTLQAASRDDADVVALWRALADVPGNAAPIDTTALQRWLRAHPARAPDPLALQEAIDTLQRKPSCGACRAELRALLWPLLAPPPAAVPRRAAADAQGRRYLDALQHDAPDAEASR